MKDYWMLRPVLHDDGSRMKEFLEQEIVAIGYPIGKSISGLSNDELKEALGIRAEGLGIVNMFVNGMNVGDIVVVPDTNKRDVYIGEIVGDYNYNAELESDGYPHTRAVSWMFGKNPLTRDTLPDPIRASLRYPGTIADITKHRHLIDNLISPVRTIQSSNYSPNKSLLETRALETLQSLLLSGSEEIRLKAAEVILSHIHSEK